MAEKHRDEMDLELVEDVGGASCAVPAPWTSTFLSPAARLASRTGVPGASAREANPATKRCLRFYGSRRRVAVVCAATLDATFLRDRVNETLTSHCRSA